VLTSGVPFERLQHDLRAMFAPDGPHAALRGETLRLDLGERDIVLFDLRRLTTMLTEEADVHVGGLVCGPEALHRYAEKQLKMRVHLSDAPVERIDSLGGGLPACEGAVADSVAADANTVPDESASVDDADAVAEAALAADGPDAAPSADGPEAAPAEGDGSTDAAPPEPDIAADDTSDAAPALSVVHGASSRRSPALALPEGGRRTVSVHRSLRSGAQVRFPGDIVIFGDVNSGAEVVADGSIVVLGALRGMAHAGAHGDQSATVMAFQLTPTNLRIAQRQAVDLPREVTPRPGLLSLLRAPGLADRGAPRGPTARVARVVDGAVVVHDYTARDPR
jgi:septum site-determining protein MinC